MSYLAMLVAAISRAQAPEQRHEPPLLPEDQEPDRKLPNGKSQKDAIAEQQHTQALKDAEQLLALSQELKDELQRAGKYVVPLATVKKTEEIERLARKIRGRLKS